MENKINAVISRSYGPLETTGCLYVFDGDRSIFNCKTIELPERGNAKSISCILPGEYWVEKIISPTKGPCFLLLYVQGRTAVEIHIGNYAAGKKVDTEGCILPGLRFEDINHDGNIDVAESTKAMEILLSIFPDKFKLTIL
jgi:hypothetical protein